MQPFNYYEDDDLTVLLIKTNIYLQIKNDSNM